MKPGGYRQRPVPAPGLEKRLVCAAARSLQAADRYFDFFGVVACLIDVPSYT